MSFTGIGTILRRGQGTNPIPAPGADTFDVVGRVRNINLGLSEKEEVEDTTLDSAGGFKEFLSGAKDPGNVEMALSFEPGTALSPANAQQDLISDSAASTAASRRNWQVEWPDGTIADFVGEVFTAQINTEPNSPVEMSVTIRKSGEVTLTYP
jgi:predicted secreted protein